MATGWASVTVSNSHFFNQSIRLPTNSPAFHSSLSHHPTRTSALPFQFKYKSSSYALLRRSPESSISSCYCHDSSLELDCCSQWDWNKWTRHFAEVECIQQLADVLEFQLAEAVEEEDFQRAAKLKTAIEETLAKDSIAEIVSLLKSAVEEERYNDASTLSRHTGSGLVGWWVGCSQDSDDPFGKLVHITPGIGRFIGRSYTPRQLVTSSPGTPLFEIYVVKDANGCYVMQAVCLQQAKKSSVNSLRTRPENTDQESVVDITLNERKIKRSRENSLDIEEVTEEGVKSVINFLKDKIPDLKVKVMDVDITEVIEDTDAIERMSQEGDEKNDSDGISDDEAIYVDEVGYDAVVTEAAGIGNARKSTFDSKVFISGAVHSMDDDGSEDECLRLPAEIKDLEKNTFVLHIPGISQYQDANESKISKVKVATIAAQGVSELMPPDIAKAFFSAGKVSSKVSKEVREIIKFAVSQAKKRNRVAEETNFSRITTPKSDLDPFEGLYIGAFGPYGTEVVQLKRKFGHWSAAGKDASNLDFFEYVEAVKLTGDLNVPAGQVSFRAKIGKGKQNPNRGLYPDELGVVASYKGQGRIAEFGFRNPQWVEGELLQLNGKGIGPYVKGGADLGFLFSVPEQSFLVLFSRLRLPE